MSGYYTNYNYRPMIAIAKDKLARAYQARLDRYNGGAYRFTRDLYTGRSGNDVIELQKRFIREGLATYTATGYFGDQTRASAIAYQIKHGILPHEGYVGPKTRTVLNNGPTPLQPDANVIAEPDAVSFE